MHIKKVVSLLLTTIFVLFTFSACYDLGDFESDEEYISTFDNFVIKKSDGETLNDFSM